MSMIERDSEKINVSEQCELLSLNRTSLYYKPIPLSDKKQKILNRIDEIYTEDPSFGRRTIGTILRREGFEISDPTVRSYMQEMGLCAIYPGPNLSKRAHESLVYPYLLRNVNIVRNNQVWGTDITYPVVVSGHRTMETQQRLMDEKIAAYTAEGYSSAQAITKAEAWVAIPGTSEHQLGIAVDINADGINSAGYH